MIERCLRTLIGLLLLPVVLLIAAIGLVVGYIMVGLLTLVSKFPGKGPTVVVEERRYSPDRWDPKY